MKYKGEAESVILSLITPRANTHIFDLDFLPKYKLWKYNNHIQTYLNNELHPKIIKHKVEKPALLDTNMVIKSKKMIEQYMENLGYFYANVEYEILIPKKQIAVVKYTIDAGKFYRIRRVSNQCESKEILQIINQNSDESLLVPGQPYTKINCGLERERLYKIIRNNGFYDFKSDNISFEIDTTNKDKIKSLLDDPFSIATVYQSKTPHNTIDVNLNVERSRDSTFSQLYTINQVKVNINSPQSINLTTLPIIENELDGIHFSYKVLPVNRKVITRNVFIHEGDVFNTNDYETTINRLNQLGVFQLVNIQYVKTQDSTGRLDCVITLTTSPKMDLIGLFDLSTSAGDYDLGTGFGLTFRDKNLAHGANSFSLRASYSTEFRNDNLLTGTNKFYQSGNNVNLSANLTFPKFIVPFNQNIFNKKNMPYTTIGATYNFIQRILNYTIINISGSYGYAWQESKQKSWRFNPVFLSVTQVPDKYLSDAFRAKRELNSYLKNTFTSSIIQGENVMFEYRTKPGKTFASFSSFKFGLEEAGTLLKGINNLYIGLAKDTIQPIAHYIKGDIDFRKYMNRRKSQWVNRLMIGVGVPVGGSRTLPYIKQFSAGGAFSNRGWRSRTLGPGHSDFQTGSTVIDKTGDIKTEFNSEFRFNLLKLFSGAINLKGAVFVDAGNIWLMYKDSSVQGGEFNPDYFFRDIAITNGIGLRLDFSFFVFRVDLGYPVKQPQLKENYGFNYGNLKLNSGLWNLALGYPF